jgi:hypothetical protein
MTCLVSPAAGPSYAGDHDAGRGNNGLASCRALVALQDATPDARRRAWRSLDDRQSNGPLAGSGGPNSRETHANSVKLEFGRSRHM